MLTETQLEERLNYIGASDCAGVLGQSSWSSPLKVWAIKTREIPQEDIGDLLHVKLGNLFEDDMTELFEEQTGKVLHKVNETKFHPQYPFIACNIDRRVVGENVPVELKTANVFKAKEWDGEDVPREYIFQCMHTLAVTGKPYMYLGVLIGSQAFIIKKIERDEKLIAEIIAREVAFWRDYVVPKIMPQVVSRYGAAADASTLDALFPQANQTAAALPDEASGLVELLDSYKADRRNLEGLIDTAENKLKLLLGDNEYGVTSTGAVVKWSNSTYTGLDQKALKAEMPEVHAKYYKSKPIRKFSYKLQQEVV